MWLLVLVPVLAVLFYVINFYRNVARHPRGPRPLPFIGNLHQLSPGKVFADIDKFANEYGNVFTLYLPLPVVILADYESLREAFVHHGEVFAARPINAVVDALNVEPNAGIAGASGENWKQQRRNTIAIFKEFGMGSHGMEAKVNESVKEFLNFVDNIPDKENVDLRWPLQLMIANIINENLFGFKYAYDNCARLVEYVEGFHKFLTDHSTSYLLLFAVSFSWIRHIPIFGYHAVWKHRANYLKLHTYIETEVDRCRREFQKDEEATCYVHGYLQRMGNNQMLTDAQLEACCSDMFAAGQETTTTVLRWAVLFLADCQDVQEKMRAEIESVVGRDRMVSMADKPLLLFTSAVVLEVLRRSNVIARNVMHRTTQDSVIQGKFIPGNTNIIGDIHRVMAKDSIFEDPEAFRPERFLAPNGRSFNKDAVDRVVPFSLGKRQCSGEGLARVELFLGLAAIVQRYRILPQANGNPIDLEPEYYNIILPKPQLLRLQLVSSCD